MSERPTVTYRIEIKQDDTEVRGNASGSGDDVEDERYEDEIIDRLNCGDVWAWASVTVIAECGGFKGRDSLGGCSYANEEAFKRGPYYEDMKSVALDDLRETLRTAVGHGEQASKLLVKLRSVFWKKVPR